MSELVNEVSISVSVAPTGLGNFNVNNVALFTSEAFLSNTNNDAYRVYVSPSAVGTDFGTSSEAYQQALALFSQQPNILAGGGNLIIFPLVGGTEDLATALARVKDMIYFCGILSTVYPSGSARKTLADTVQALGDKILFLSSATYADVAGVFTDIRTAGDYNTVCLLHTASALQARLFAAAAAGRGMSVNFAGSRTANTLNLKQLATIPVDTGITQTYYNAAATAGVDLYVSYAGVSAYVSNGANKYFDQKYNLIWFVNQLKVNGFNALALVGTKIPQTEPGMSQLKGAYRQVCEAALNNGYVAPGAWNSAEWFGSQDDMINNILQRGYYIYSQPVNLQSQAVRVERIAPSVQIAAKLAGAIQQLNVVLSINA